MVLYRSILWIATRFTSIAVMGYSQDVPSTNEKTLKNMDKYITQKTRARWYNPNIYSMTLLCIYSMGYTVYGYQAPIPLMILWWNSKFDQDLKCSDLKCALLITTEVCTRHDSVTVLTCAKFPCDRLSMYSTAVLQISIKTLLVGWGPELW